MIPAIHRKLLRDLTRLKGQVLTIALVIAAGIASFVALQGNYASLEHAREAFYERQRFARIFARLERAPKSLRTSLEAIPGVERVQTRVVEQATLPLPQLPEPVRASLVGLPDAEQEALNYARYFKFPNLGFRFAPRDALLGAAISLLAAMTGAFGAIQRVVRMPPAEAMRPPAPAQYRRSLVDRLGLGGLAGPSLQMILRELERRPLRAAMSAAAIAAATSLSMVAGWYWDGIETLVRTQFQVAMREDAAVSFVDPVPERAVRELAHLPGVLSAEGVRVVPVRFRTGHHRRDGVLWGYAETAEMRTLRDNNVAIAKMADRVIRLGDGRVTSIERKRVKATPRELEW